MSEVQCASVPDCAGSVPGPCLGCHGVARSEPNRAVKPFGTVNVTRTTPLWLAEKVETSRRAARLETCPKCAADILTGPDADRCAVIVRVDLEPVGRLAEAVAVLAGRYSCDLIGSGLSHRDSFQLESPRQPWPIHLEHRCPPVPKETLF